MGKRQEIRAKRRRERQRRQLFIIGLVVVGALLISVAFILPGLQQQDPGNIVQITPKTFTATVEGTSIGDPNAPVKMDVWEDFQCPTCLTYSTRIVPLIIQNYVDTGKVYYTFHFFPLFGLDKNESTNSANASLCAAEQDRFWDYHDMLFANWNGENQGAFNDTRLVAFAQNLELDMTAFNKCYKARTYDDQVAQDFQDGQAIGVHSTPSIFVNGQKAENSTNPNSLPTYDELSRFIDEALGGQ